MPLGSYGAGVSSTTIATTTALYHYTCSCSLAAIYREGLLRPHAIPGQDPLVWLTDFDTPLREALGLTMNLISCDRTEFRFQVDLDDVEPGVITPWHRYARHVNPDLRRALDWEPGAMPMHWWVATDPVPVKRG